MADLWGRDREILLTINRHGGFLQAWALARHLGLWDGRSVTHDLVSLEQRGFVRRNPSAGPHYWALTNYGHDTAKALAEGKHKRVPVATSKHDGQEPSDD